MHDFVLDGRRIGPGAPPLVIAELSGNHNGSLERALALVDAAAAAGAGCIKLQTYTADTITLDSDRPEFLIQDGPWRGRRLHELYREASTPWDWHAALAARARHHGLPWFSSPFDPTAVDFLESLDCPAYKVASFEVVDIPLLQRIAATGKPVIMSTGMATRAEIDEAVTTLRRQGCTQLGLLACLSSYPADPAAFRLANIATLARDWSVIAGLSDHSPGHHVAAAAVACGATIIEKHLCLRRADGGPDAGFSLEPDEFAALCRAVAEVHAAVQRPPAFGPAPGERDNLTFRKSLFYTTALPAGHRLGPNDLRVVRPGHGLHPRHYHALIGSVLTRAVEACAPVREGDCQH
jgi:N-acetylneuraminate synthase